MARLVAIGSHILFHKLFAATKDVPQHHKTFDAIVTGYEMKHDHDVDKDGLPHINLAYLNPEKFLALGGADWAQAFERVYSVPHEDVNDEGPSHYSVIASEEAGLPSDADLDAAVATAEEEARAKEATSGKKNGKPKPVAVGK